MRRLWAPRRPLLAVAALAALVVAVPLLLAVLTLAPGGLPHECRLETASSHDVSLAALDRIDRFLQGALSVGLSPLLACDLDLVMDLAARADVAAVRLDTAPAAEPVERGALERRF